MSYQISSNKRPHRLRWLSLALFPFIVLTTQNCSRYSAGDAAGNSDATGASVFHVNCEWPQFPRAEHPMKTKNTGNCDTALAEQYSGDCENFHWKGLMGDPVVIKDSDGKFKMWFTSGERVNGSSWRAVISYAESSDGVLWEDPKDLLNDAKPVFATGSAGIDPQGSETSFVFKSPNGGYQMLFTGDLSVAPDTLHVIGRATSADGKSWTKDSTPALTATLPWEQPFDAGGFQVGGVLEPSVLVDSDGYHLWYQAFGQNAADSPAYARFGYATSADGKTWTKRPDPIFMSSKSDFDRSGVGHVNVVRDPNGKYHMFYVGISTDETLRIGHATSPDGIHWTQNPHNPIIEGKAGEWDAGLVGGPSAVIVDGELYLYYMGGPTKDFSDIHFARTKAVCSQ